MITIPERLETLQAQVKAMEDGTNPVVFFPSNTTILPKLPEGFKSYRKEELGLIYYNPKALNEDLIKESIDKGMFYALLGFVQKKEEAVKGIPIAISVRDMNNNEIKTAVVDSKQEELVALQSYIFHQWFPNCVVIATTVFDIVADRIKDVSNG